MKTWTETFIHHLLQRQGLFYAGGDDMLMRSVAEHHSHILLHAERLAKLVTDKLAHDAVFKEVK